MTTKRRAPGVLAAVRRDLLALPEPLRDTAEAAAAKELAKAIDEGTQVVAASRQLAALMTSLRSRGTSMRATAPPPVASQKGKPSPVADLTKRIADARRGSSAG